MADRSDVAAGPVAAYVAAMAARVIAAAADSVSQGALAAQARSLGQRLDRLAYEDAAAFGAARDALDSATGGGDERRDFALGQALDRAADVPLAIAEASADVVALAQEIEPLADTRNAPAVGAAAHLAAGAARAAAHLVEATLAMTPNDARLDRALRAAAAL